MIERHLIDGMEEIFEGERVHRLTDGQVKQLMEEDSVTAAKRRELKDQEFVLQSSLDICRDIAHRPDVDQPEDVGYSTSTRSARYDWEDDVRAESPPPNLPVRNPFVSGDSYSPARKPIPTWDDAGIQPLSGNYLPAVATPTTAEDEDAQLKRAIEESKRDQSMRNSYQAPPMPQRPIVDDDSSSRNSRKRGVGGLFDGIRR